MSADVMDLDDARDSFWREGYMFVSGYLSEAVTTLVARYALMEYVNNPRPDVDGTVPAQVPGAHSVYADPLAESVLDLATADVGRLIGRTLIPTYAFYRVYRPSDSLKPHTDRISCEVSASVCLGYRVDGPDARPWPLGIRTDDPEPVNLELEQMPGDLIIYRGVDCIHWRRRLVGGPESWHAQLFLHWVDADGPFAELCAYDTRPSLGLGEDRRDPRLTERMTSVQQALEDERAPRLRHQYQSVARALADDFDVSPERAPNSPDHRGDRA